VSLTVLSDRIETSRSRLQKYIDNVPRMFIGYSLDRRTCTFSLSLLSLRSPDIHRFDSSQILSYPFGTIHIPFRLVHLSDNAR